MAYVNVEHVSKRFADVQALHDVSFEVAADELLVVLGATGAGKTTLLRCLAGLEQPDAGAQLTLQDHDLLSQAPAQRDMALVFQNFSLYPDWTVRKNLLFPLKSPGRKIPDAECDALIHWAAALLHMEHLLERKASRLSGGEMQRVAIGRAIVRKPRLFLMDEPLTNLDAKLREELRLEIVKLRRDLGTPMIYVTHDQAEALSMADRIVVLDQGRVLQVGTAQEIYNNPQSPAVARQLGQPSINIIAVEACAGFWCSADGQAWIPCQDADGVHAQLGIRPEHIKPSVQESSLIGVIRLCELSGPDLIIAADIHGAPVHFLWSKQVAVKAGERIPLHIEAEHVIVWRQ